MQRREFIKFLSLTPLISRLAFAESKVSMSTALLHSEFIYEAAPFPSCHASTILETENGLLAAWFGGTREGAQDVCIYTARFDGEKWSAPQLVANGIQNQGERFPCWNPVLFQPKNGALFLFYKVGPSPSKWWGEVKTSNDNGQNWSIARRLPSGILGPIKNKPLQLQDGTILSPTSDETDNLWRVHFEISHDNGQTWRATPPQNDGKNISAIQPSILLHDGALQAIGRTRQGHIFEIWSHDRGASWDEMKLLDLPNNNSGTDAVTLADGRQLLVYNHVGLTPGKSAPRTPLNVAISRDGKKWESVLVLEDTPGEYSYPAVIQAKDGTVHITYTWKRERIKHIALDPRKLA